MVDATDILTPFFLSDEPDTIRQAAEAVLEVSSGRVTKPELTNLRTKKPERGGLCCAKVFGPIADHQCLCGKLSSIEFAGQTCDKCGVLCGEARLRSERWGHIESPVPLAHPRLFTQIARLLRIETEVLIDTLHHRIDDEENRGSAAVIRMLGDKTHWLFTQIPIPPPDFRNTKNDPQNDAYMRLINRCNRLARLIELNAPQIILDNEERMVQEAVERLCATVREELIARATPVTTAPTTDESEALLQAIYEDPGHDLLRKEYAAYLKQHDDPRGTFISLQLEPAAKKRKKLSKPESDLLRRNYENWLPLHDVVEQVLFRRGFLASCKTTKEAANHIGDPAWSTVEEIDSDLVELMTHPTMRALKRIRVSFKTFQGLCDEPKDLRINHALVRLSRCPPQDPERVTHHPIPSLRSLELNASSKKADWSWLDKTPLLDQIPSLTITLGIGLLPALRVHWWMDLLSHHQQIERLHLSVSKGAIRFELSQESGVVELLLRLNRSGVEMVAMSEEIPREIGDALEQVETHPSLHMLRVDQKYSWFGDSAEALAERLGNQFGAVAPIGK